MHQSLDQFIDTGLLWERPRHASSAENPSPPSSRCDRRCIYAKGKRCTCRCGGANHGWHWRYIDNQREELLLNHIPEIFSMFEDVNCMSCGHPLKYAEIRGYPHDGGLYIEDYKMRMWVYARCFKCGYDISWKKVRGQEESGVNV